MLDVDTRRYFAYGSNMDRQQMRGRCPGAVLLGTARLPGYRFIINRAGVASVVSMGCHEVLGVLWDITATDEGALDDYEGVGEGWYYKTILPLITPNGREQAMLYIACDQTEGAPHRHYMANIVAAALDFDFPATYVGELRSWLRR
jgi:gamma-glutamylcyclotransferase